MKITEKKADELGLRKHDLTTEEASALYSQTSTEIEVEATTLHSRKRRRGQLSWRSVVNIIRADAKKQKAHS